MTMTKAAEERKRKRSRAKTIEAALTIAGVSIAVALFDWRVGVVAVGVLTLGTWIFRTRLFRNLH